MTLSVLRSGSCCENKKRRGGSANEITNEERWASLPNEDERTTRPKLSLLLLSSPQISKKKLTSMQINQHPQPILCRPVDRSNDPRPRVDVRLRDGFEGSSLSVGRTERPVSDGETDGVDSWRISSNGRGGRGRGGGVRREGKGRGKKGAEAVSSGFGFEEFNPLPSLPPLPSFLPSFFRNTHQSSANKRNPPP